MSNFIPMVSSSPPPMDDGGGFGWDDDDEFGTFTGASAAADTSQTDELGVEILHETIKMSPNLELRNTLEHLKDETTDNDKFDSFADCERFSNGNITNAIVKENVHNVTNITELDSENLDDSTKGHDACTSGNETNDVNTEHISSSLIDSGLYSANISPMAHSNELSESLSPSEGSDADSSSLNELDKIPTDDSAGCSEQPCECQTLSSDDITILPQNSEHDLHSERIGSDMSSFSSHVDLKHSDPVCKTSLDSIPSQDSPQFPSTINIPTCPLPNIPDADTCSSSHSHEVITQITVNSVDNINDCKCDLQQTESDDDNSQCPSEKIVTKDENCFNGMAATEPDAETCNSPKSVLEESSGQQADINSGSGEHNTSDITRCVAVSAVQFQSVSDSDARVKPDEDNDIDERMSENGNFCAILTNDDEEILDDYQTTESVPSEKATSDTGANKIDDIAESLEESVPSHNFDKTDDVDGTLSNSPEATVEVNICDNEPSVVDSGGQHEFSAFESIPKDESNIETSEPDKTDNNFGDFNSTVELNNDKDSGFANFKSSSEQEDDDDDDFGDFNTSIGTEDKFTESMPGFTNVGESKEIDKSATASGGEWASFSEPQLSVTAQVDEDDADDWGNFDNEPIHVQETPKAEVTSKLEDQAGPAESNLQNMSKQDKVLYAVSGCFSASLRPVEEPGFGTFEDTFSATDVPKSDCVYQIWSGMKGLQSTNALTYQWPQSKWNGQLFTTLHVDTRNILIGHKKASVPIFASGLTLLEPTKGPVKPEVAGAAHVEETLVDTCTAKPDVLQVASQETIPPAQFDWSTSGLTNPLEATNKTLNLDFLIQESEQATKSNALESEFLGNSLDSPAHKSTIQPLEDILANLKSSSTFKPTNQHEDLSSEARKVIQSLPHMNFMTSKVLMFPLKLDD